MPTEPALHTRFDTAIREVRAGPERFSLLTVRDTNALVDAIEPETFAMDERFPYWAELWASAVTLAAHMAAVAPGRTVLELGCGLGLAGIAAARAGAEVTMTDFEPDALLFAAKNAARNLEPHQMARVTIREMDWRSPALDAKYDIVIGADILYERRFFAPLRTLLEQAVSPAGVVLLAEPDRAVGRAFFAEAAAAGWSVESERIAQPWNPATLTVTLNTLRPRLHRPGV